MAIASRGSRAASVPGYECVELQPLIEFYYHTPDTQRDFLLSFWWLHYDGVQSVHCYEGQEVRFIARGEVSRYPMLDYLSGVWDLALAAQKRTPKRKLYRPVKPS